MIATIIIGVLFLGYFLWAFRSSRKSMKSNKCAGCAGCSAGCSIPEKEENTSKVS